MYQKSNLSPMFCCCFYKVWLKIKNIQYIYIIYNSKYLQFPRLIFTTYIFWFPKSKLKFKNKLKVKFVISPWVELVSRRGWLCFACVFVRVVIAFICHQLLLVFLFPVVEFLQFVISRTSKLTHRLISKEVSQKVTPSRTAIFDD